MSASSGGWASPSGGPSEPAPPVGRPPAQSPAPPPAAQPPSYGAGYAPPPGWQPPPGWGGPSGGPSGGGAGWGGGWGAPVAREPQPGVVPLRPLGLGELLDGAVSVIRRYPRPSLGLSAAISIVTTVLNVVLAVTAFRPLIRFDTSTLSNGGTASMDQIDGVLGGAAIGGIGSSLLTALATLVLTGVMTAIAGRAVLGRSMTLGEAWVEVRAALGRLIGIALLTGLIVYGSIALCVTVAALLIAATGAAGAIIGVPLGIGSVLFAVYAYCRLALAPSVALLEKAGVRTSLRRSGVLVRRSWWRVFGILLLTMLIAGFVSQVVQVPFLVFGIGPTGLTSGSSLSHATTQLLVLSYIGSGIAQTVVAPFTAAVRSLLYIDRRMRAEGLDVALNAAVAQRAA